MKQVLELFDTSTPEIKQWFTSTWNPSWTILWCHVELPGHMQATSMPLIHDGEPHCDFTFLFDSERQHIKHGIHMICVYL